MLRNLFVVFLFCFGAGSSAQADIITSLVGNVSMQPVPITLDNPDAATAIDGVLHIGGSHQGRAAVQLVDLATGTVGDVQFFESLASAAGANGDQTGYIRDIAQLATGEVLYAGQSAGLFDKAQPTTWLAANNPAGGVGPNGQPESGTYVATSQSGISVGTVGDSIFGNHSQLPSFLPGTPASILAKDISTDGTFIVGDHIWRFDGQNNYDIFNANNFDYTTIGDVAPSWSAVEIDPLVGQAVFAGEFFNLSTFESEVGFWNQDGTFRFSVGAGSFTDFEIFDGQLVAAINGFDDSSLWALTDGSSLTLESILGEKTLIYDDGLFVGSVGFAGSNASGGSFVASFSAVPEPSSLALFGIGSAGLGLFRRRRNIRQGANV